LAGKKNMKKRYRLWAAVPGLVLCWLLVGGCGESRDPYVGMYRSKEPYADKGHVDLVLKVNGEATWTLKGKTIKFKWTVDNGRLRFYTKEGGIIHVTPTEGGKKLSVDMTGDWNPICPTKQCILFERVVRGGS